MDYFAKAQIQIFIPMSRIVFLMIVLFVLKSTQSVFAQNEIDKEVFGLFDNSQPLPIKLTLSFKEVKKNTNDSIYLNTHFSYRDNDSIWKNVPVKLKRRGNFRLQNCYYTPLKLKIKKKVAQTTILGKNRKLKVVFPCLVESNSNDNVIKEFIAYKLYETISPYYFNTRLLDIQLDEIKGKRNKRHHIKGFFIEDVGAMAERYEAHVLKRKVHTLGQDEITSVKNAFFQFMIGNTDFSTSYQHNEKLIFLNYNTYPVPYDFDMSGLVDASYSTVSVIQGEQLPISTVKKRLYRGFIRDDKTLDAVRAHFLSKKSEIMNILETHASYFEKPKSYIKCRDYIESFFSIIEDNQKYKKLILNKMRIK